MNAQHFTGAVAQDAKSITAQVLEQLRDDLITCVLRPGERLPVLSLARDYGAAPTTIREALSRLVTEGLVSVENQRGFSVAPASLEDLRDLTETRIELEQLAITRAIAAGGIDWEAEVLAAGHRLLKSSAPGTGARGSQSIFHRQFHDALTRGCGLSWLSYLCEALYEKSERYRHLSAIDGPGTRTHDDLDDEHESLMQVVLARDSQKARALIASHYRKTSDIVVNALSQHR